MLKNETKDFKPKSLIVNGHLHTIFSEFCKKNKLKIGGITENLIEKYLNEKDIKID